MKSLIFFVCCVSLSLLLSIVTASINFSSCRTSALLSAVEEDMDGPQCDSSYQCGQFNDMAIRDPAVLKTEVQVSDYNTSGCGQVGQSTDPNKAPGQDPGAVKIKIPAD